MGEKLMFFYQYIYDSEGVTGKMKLAQETKVPSVEAAILLDTPEKIELFRTAVMRITGKPLPPELEQTTSPANP